MTIEEYLKEYARLENEKLDLTLLTISEELKWISEIFLLISKFEKFTLSSLPIKWRTSLALSQMVNKEVHLCFLSIGRKHISQAFSNMRLAIESAGFINAIKDNIENGEIWMRRGFKDINNKSYKELEKIRWSGNLGPELKNRFASASEQSHANLIKTLFSVKSKVEQKEGKVEIRDHFDFFDDPEPAAWLITSTHWLIDTCFIILLLLGDVFKEHLKDSDFQVLLEAKYHDYKNFIYHNLDRVLITHKLKKPS